MRAVLSQPLYDPASEADVMGLGHGGSGAPPNPAALLKGPLPASTVHDGAITALGWLDAPLRLLLTGSEDGLVRIWR